VDRFSTMATMISSLIGMVDTTPAVHPFHQLRRDRPSLRAVGVPGVGRPAVLGAALP
jgi:hypothetical protein